jgi:hypothetical protein
MAVKLQGFSNVIAEVGSTLRALRVQPAPIDPGSNGAYRVALVTGILPAALAASGEVFQFRWTHATKLAVVTKLKTRFLPLAAFTAATLTDHTSFDAFKVTGFSAAGTGGTATATSAAFPTKMRNSFATSQVGEIRIATTAALGGGTKTIDTSPFAQSIRRGNRVNPAAATEEVIQPNADGLDTDFNMADGDYPIILGGAGGGANSEGIIVRNRTVWPAAGTGILSVTMAWTEVDAF